MEWKLAEAKIRLGELMTKATTEGPQTIRRGGETVVVLAEPVYRALLGDRPTFKEWLMNGPRTGKLELPLRGQTAMRGVDL